MKLNSSNKNLKISLINNCSDVRSLKPCFCSSTTHFLARSKDSYTKRKILEETKNKHMPVDNLKKNNLSTRERKISTIKLNISLILFLHLSLTKKRYNIHCPLFGAKRGRWRERKLEKLMRKTGVQ